MINVQKAFAKMDAAMLTRSIVCALKAGICDANCEKIYVTAEPPGVRPTQREALDEAQAILAGSGLKMTPFGLEVNERVVAGEITSDEALAILLAHYRAKSPE